LYRGQVAGERPQAAGAGRDPGRVRNARPDLRSDQAQRAVDGPPEGARPRRGRRDPQPRLQGADLRHLPLLAGLHAGRAHQRDLARQRLGGDRQVHERPRPDLGPEGRAHLGGDPAILYQRGEGGVEVRVRPSIAVDGSFGLCYWTDVPRTVVYLHVCSFASPLLWHTARCAICTTP
jgi:hypothetical protein